MTSWYVLGDQSRPEGPYSTDQLISQIRSGELPSAAKINRGGSAEWRPAVQIEELRGVLSARRAAMSQTLAPPKQPNRWLIQYGLVLLIAVAVGFIGVALARTW